MDAETAHTEQQEWLRRSASYRSLQCLSFATPVAIPAEPVPPLSARSLSARPRADSSGDTKKRSPVGTLLRPPRSEGSTSYTTTSAIDSAAALSRAASGSSQRSIRRKAVPVFKSDVQISREPLPQALSAMPEEITQPAQGGLEEGGHLVDTENYAESSSGVSLQPSSLPRRKTDIALQSLYRLRTEAGVELDEERWREGQFAGTPRSYLSQARISASSDTLAPSEWPSRSNRMSRAPARQYERR